MSKHFDKLKVEKLPHSEAELTGELTVEFLQECRAEALKELNKSVTLAGFRPGMVPEETLIKSVGEMRVLEETAEIALGREYGNIVKEAGLYPITRPQVTITKLAPGIPLEFKIKLTLEPEFALPDYKKLSQEVAEENKEKRRLKIIEALVQATTLTLPPILIEEELKKIILQMQEDVKRAGLKWEDYLKEIKKSEEEIKTELRPKAEDRLKAELILGKIGEMEKLEPKAEDLEHEAAHLLEHYPEADPLRVRLYLYSQLRNEKVFEFLENQK